MSSHLANEERHADFSTSRPFHFQIEDWKFVAYPHPDWAFVSMCGSNPALNFNGAFVLARERNLDGLAFLPEVELVLRATAESLGIDYDAMCESDNTDCPV